MSCYVSTHSERRFRGPYEAGTDAEVCGLPSADTEPESRATAPGSPLFVLFSFFLRVLDILGLGLRVWGLGGLRTLGLGGWC